MLTNKSEPWKLYAHCLTSRVQSDAWLTRLLVDPWILYLCLLVVVNCSIASDVFVVVDTPRFVCLIALDIAVVDT